MFAESEPSHVWAEREPSNVWAESEPSNTCWAGSGFVSNRELERQRRGYNRKRGGQWSAEYREHYRAIGRQRKTEIMLWDVWCSVRVSNVPGLFFWHQLNLTDDSSSKPPS